MKPVLIAAVIFSHYFSSAFADQLGRRPDVRMAGWHRTMVATPEEAPNTSVQTYLAQSTTATLANVLAKFAPSVNGRGAEGAADVVVEDFPGGVRVTFRLGEVRVTSEVTPLFVGRGTPQCQGAALYSVTTTPPAPITVGIGGPGEQQMGVTPDVRKDALLPVEALEVDGSRAIFVTGRELLIAGVQTTAPLEPVVADPGQALSVTFPEGRGSILLVYADDREQVLQLLRLDESAARNEVAEYYQALLAQSLDTPEDELDAAWRSALYNLEYNWNEPYGWNECIHHWLAMWHNQHTAGAEWIGQEDRSRLCTVTLAENLLPSGAVPHFTMDGGRRRDFGGSNQIWAWQARHYWKFTGDADFAAIAAPALDRILAQTLEEHDPDHNLLVGWGLQIGNQEDFIQFYNDAATPSIELINMMRTRAELAEGLGDASTGALWRGRANKASSLLREHLWMKDLGRFASYVDEHGKKRLDGQYHTFLYPTIWDIVGELDGYTSLRHVHDLLTGSRGEVYCSNNFPNHDNGTWGMQAGAAQQPWAAWAYSQAGQRNETYRPLLAIAREVMNDNLRGSWPEVMLEHTPAYFTPPAGLYVAAVVEALFGLRVDKPAGTLHVAPCFPDHWPQASMKLADYSATYRRDENTLNYTVTSVDALARELRWSLPPSRVKSVALNGETVPFTLVPGVERTVVEVSAPPSTETTFTIRSTPVEYSVLHDGSVAEGDVLTVSVKGAEIVSVDDRCGVASNILVAPCSLDAQIAQDLISPYMGYGRLGQITFSRRTFFLECEANGERFWHPIDITVLPRHEVAPLDDLQESPDGLLARVLIRNNTQEPLSGTSWLRTARHDFPFHVDVPARSEASCKVPMPAGVAPLLSVGDNNASVTLPSGEDLPITLSAASLYANEPLSNYASARLTAIPLPEDDLSPYQEWVELREGSHAGPVPWPGWVQPLEGIEEQAEFSPPDLPGFVFRVTPGKWVLVGERIGAPSYSLELEMGYYKKFFLLIAAFADNHDMFTQVGRVTVRGEHQVIRSRPLYMPGDLDWWERHGMADTMDTARYGRPDRFGLLPLLSPDASFWSDGPPPDLPTHPGLLLGGVEQVPPAWIPPSFPQPEYWAACRVLQTPNCNFNVVEVDLGEPMPATRLTLESTGVCPGFALYGVVAERRGGAEHLQDSRWIPEPRFREPVFVFDIRSETDLRGWQLEGAAFGPAVGLPSLNTLVPSGESATGRALSPPFVIPAEMTTLNITFHGGHNKKTGDADNLVIRVLEGDTGEVLVTVPPPGTHTLTSQPLDVSAHAGKPLRLEILDENTEPSYAWIGLRSVSITP